MTEKQQLTEAQKVELTKAVRKMALSSLGMNLAYVFFLFFISMFTTLLGVTVVHSTIFCAIAGFMNYILYYKLLQDAQKKQKEKYSKKFKEIIGQ